LRNQFDDLVFSISNKYFAPWVDPTGQRGGI
jgi:hypothetical protein